MTTVEPTLELLDPATLLVDLNIRFSTRRCGVFHVRPAVGTALWHTRRPHRSAAWRGPAGVGGVAGAAG
jgi:hypothetical protein